MVEEGFDVVICIIWQLGLMLIVCKFVDVCIILCVLLVYLVVYGYLQQLEDLVGYQCLNYSYWGGGDVWQLCGLCGEVSVVICGGICVNNGDVLCDVVIVGLGIILQLDFLVDDVLVDG